MTSAGYIVLALCLIAAVAGKVEAVNRQDIGIRDPFIYCDPASGRCYMYGTTGTFDHKRGFDVRETSDPTLQTWSKPHACFRSPEDFWGVWAYWAPEVHEYKGKYYLFSTFEAPGRARAVQILQADSPAGPFHVHSPEPLTPPEYFSLDGTLYVDKKGDPWMVYSREHVSVGDGQMRAMRLKPDLTAPAEPLEDILMFKASSATYAAHWDRKEGGQGYLTDGPQMLRLSNGDLVMAWSTNNYLPRPIGWGYTVSIAKSESGEVQGPWHQEGILYNGFAGHGQIFRHPSQGLILSVHQPNNGHWGGAYPLFLHVYEKNGKLTMAEPTTPGYVQAYWRFEDLTPGHPVLPSIDILDYSGKDNHLRGDALETDGIGSSTVTAGRIPATARLNLFCYDNNEASKEGAEVRHLSTADHAINKLQLKNWTIEASIFASDVTKPQVFLAREGDDLHFGLTADGHVEIHWSGQSVASKEPISPSKWYNLAAVWDGSRMRLYIDDGKGYVLQGGVKLTEPKPAEGKWYVGCGIADGKPADQFRGLIDEVRISDKALTPASFLFARKAGH